MQIYVSAPNLYICSIVTQNFSWHGTHESEQPDLIKALWFLSILYKLLLQQSGTIAKMYFNVLSDTSYLSTVLKSSLYLSHETHGTFWNQGTVFYITYCNVKPNLSAYLQQSCCSFSSASHLFTFPPANLLKFMPAAFIYCLRSLEAHGKFSGPITSLPHAKFHVLL